MTWSPVIRRRDSRSCNSSRGIWSQRYHFAARLPPTAPPTEESTDNATARPIRRQNRMAPAPPGEHVETMGTRREGGGGGGGGGAGPAGGAGGRRRPGPARP